MPLVNGKLGFVVRGSFGVPGTATQPPLRCDQEESCDQLLRVCFPNQITVTSGWHLFSVNYTLHWDFVVLKIVILTMTRRRRTTSSCCWGSCCSSSPGTTHSISVLISAWAIFAVNILSSSCYGCSREDIRFLRIVSFLDSLAC